MNKQQLENYVRFLKSVQKPDLEGVWLDGRDCAENKLSLQENPYNKDSKEYFYWNEGWWAGFYEEEQISLLNESVSLIKNRNLSSKLDKKKSMKNSFKKVIDEINNWVEDIGYILGTFMGGIIVYELVDLAL
ncbi:MAG: hypothetical protein HRT87_07845 [Legionellales bacterium]|nr:hypothetical protein [Legionellales bacterium]